MQSKLPRHIDPNHRNTLRRNLNIISVPRFPSPPLILGGCLISAAILPTGCKPPFNHVQFHTSEWWPLELWLRPQTKGDIFPQYDYTHHNLSADNKFRLSNLYTENVRLQKVVLTTKTNRRLDYHGRVRSSRIPGQH